MSDHWIQTHGGLAFDIREEPLAFDISDIAHSLSKQCRYAGHVWHHYSVALHSLCVERALQIEAARIGWSVDKTVDVALWALLHDGGESYLVDIPSPFKRLPELEGYRRLEGWLDEKMRAHFKINVIPVELEIVRNLDVGMLYPERMHLHIRSPRPWKYGSERVSSCVQAWNELWYPNLHKRDDQIAAMFVERWDQLRAQRESSRGRWSK